VTGRPPAQIMSLIAKNILKTFKKFEDTLKRIIKNGVKNYVIAFTFDIFLKR
jgi:predicted peroxiredoxin